MVDLYYELYGRKKPVSVPLPELAALKAQRVEKPKGDKDVGGKVGRDSQGGREGASRKYACIASEGGGGLCKSVRSKGGSHKVGPGGVKKSQTFAYILYGRPLRAFPSE